jgi:hypothetical protein
MALDFRMILEPGGEAFTGSIREQVYDSMQVEVNQDRSIFLAFPPSPIIDAQVVNWGSRYLRRLLSNAPQNRVITGANGQPCQQPLSGQTAGDVTDEPQMPLMTTFFCPSCEFRPSMISNCYIT